MDGLKTQLTVRKREQLLKLTRSLNLRTKTGALPAITHVERGDRAPLSFAQQRLWFLAQIEGGSAAYHLPLGMWLRGRLDTAALKRALDRIMERHEALRTTFLMVDGEPQQKIAPAEECRFQLREHDLRHSNNAQGERERLIAEEIRSDFDLERGPLIRGRLIRTGEDEHALLITMHHIVSDGWSLAVLFKEMSVLYGAYVRKEEDPLPELTIQYPDYAIWQRKWMEGEALSAQAEFWKQNLAGAPDLLELPADRVRPARQDYAGAAMEVAFGEKLTSGLKELSRRHGTTLFMTLLAGWTTLLGRLSGQQDVVIGTPVANRGQVEIENLIGLFVNTLTLRLDLSGSPTVADMLERVKKQTLAAQHHQDMPFEQIVDLLQPLRSLAHSPLFQVMFIWQNTRERKLELPGLEVKPVQGISDVAAPFDLTMSLEETGRRIVGGVEYATSLYDRPTVERYLGYLRRLLEGMVTEPGAAIDRLPLLPETERDQLLKMQGETGREHEYPAKKYMHELFEEQASKIPHAVAVVFEDSSLTYEELNRRANRLAHYLIGLGIKPESRVGICLERGMEMIVAMLAVLKAGGAYVPMDPDNPPARINYMLTDSAQDLVLTQKDLLSLFHEMNTAPRLLDLSNEYAWSGQPETNPDRTAIGLTPEHLAYIIYTSGSTGKPKGVCVGHASLSQFLNGIGTQIGAEGQGERWLALTKLSFDISILETLWTLTGGFQVVVGDVQKLIGSGTRAVDRRSVQRRKMDFSLFYFASDDHSGADKYRLLLEGAKFADRNGFVAVWNPERHFHVFGGIYPNPAVTSAAVAAITEHIQVRAGSVVMPLQNPLRVAEEWSVIDNLSNGRAAISFASGWNPDDFVLAPEQYRTRRECLLRDLQVVRRLWRGESVTLTNGVGKQAEVRIHPRPIQPELKYWMTTGGSPESFRTAGEIGANLLTHLLGQTVEQLAEKIAIYRNAWREHGHKGQGHISLMVHTFLGADAAWVKEKVRAPFSNYLAQSVDLLKPLNAPSDGYQESDVEALISHAFERYFGNSGLMGTMDSCLAMVDRLKGIEVDELACLIDFGVDYESVMNSLVLLNELRQKSNASVHDDTPEVSPGVPESITHLQCTPSTCELLLTGEDTRRCLHETPRLFLGGEPLPGSLVKHLQQAISPQIYNLYGPTETTIWSTVHEVSAEESESVVSIGNPFGCNRVFVLDDWRELVPVGVAGELYIGGEQVARGYFGQPGLTAERFVPNPFDGKGCRLYRTGDLVKWQKNGTLEFVRRIDHQVKIRGFRIELEEIGAQLREHKEVKEAVVVVREDTPREKRLVAYYTVAERDLQHQQNGTKRDMEAGELRAFLMERLPDYMVPAAYVCLERMPLTPNGKLDRKALPMPEGDAYGVRKYEPPRGETEEILARIWAELLKVERVGRYDNFFELGGHSLLAVTAIERMRRQGLQVDVGALFATPTVADLAVTVGGKARRVVLPPNRIPPGCDALTPEMLPLVELSQEEINRIVAEVPGGAQNVQDIYPLAPLQEGIMFHHLMGGEGDPYNLTWIIGFDSRMRLTRYVETLQKLVDRHDILRTAVVWEGLREPLQVVWRKAKLRIEEVRLENGDESVAEQLYHRYDPRLTRIDLRQAPMMCGYAAEDLKRKQWVLLLMLYHLAGDHTTLEAMHHEMESYLSGEENRLPPLVPFRNLIAESRLGVGREEHEKFFRGMLADVEEPTAPFGFLEVQHDGSGIREARVELDRALSRRVRERARKLGVSAASIFHVAWGRVMSKLSQRADVVFGTVVFGRMQGVGLDHVMGLVINTLPVRMQVSEERVETSVRQMQGLLADLMRHEHAPLTLAQRCSGVPALTPLFSALLNYRYSPNIPKGGLVKTNPVWEGVEFLRTQERSNYPLTLSADDYGEDFSLTALTLAAIDPQRLCEYMCTALTSLTELLEYDPGRAVWTIEVLPAAEREQVLYGWNNTATAIPDGKCLQELFEEQVERTPQAVALVHLDSMLSYNELNRQANRLAHYLRSLGVKPGMRVGICCERGLQMVVALVAILKAGAAYVPLDPNYPVERLRYMVEDAALATVLIQADEVASGLFQNLALVLPIINLTDSASQWHNYPNTNIDRTAIGLNSDDLAYVIYTSGSTGRPKASAIPHRGIPGFIFGIDYARFDNKAVFLQHSSASWDALTLELWPALLTGGRCVLARQRVLSADEIGDFVKNEGVNTLFLPSALLDAIVEIDVGSLRGVRDLFTGGQIVPVEAVKMVLEHLPGTRLVNGYGPSECTVVSTCYVVPRELPKNIASVPIGEPVGDRQVYVLDDRMDPAPVGVIGEIYIGGPSVPWGYLNQADLTAEKFVPDPWGGQVGARLYRTGDLGKWLGDGTIDFARRHDDQVKIRGYRIALGEIEARLREYDGVREAVVAAREDGGEMRLVAYYTVARTEQAANGTGASADAEMGIGRVGAKPEDLRGYLLTRLPEYMVPVAYVCMDQFPVTRHWKVDREALPAPDGDAYAAGLYEPPDGATETALASIWMTLLNVERVGRYDNFFALGGHSLLASQLVLRIYQALGVKIDIREVFEFGQLSALAACVRRAQFAEFDSEEFTQMMRNS